MNEFHPNAKRAAACALTALLAVGGCRSSSSVATNPFMGPDRVTPPSTRMLAPGQAQPYYQGDPLPVMQSSTTPAVTGPVASDGASRTDSGKTLAWNAPASASVPPAANAPYNAVATNSTRPASPWDQPAQAVPLAVGNEPPVSVPTDTDGLRFAPPAASPSAGTLSNSSITPNAAVPQDVAFASYNAPAGAITNGLAPVTTTAATLPATPSTSPWQKPQLGGPSQPIYTTPLLPMALPTNAMGVDLRSVPSPAPQPGDPVPRIRIPGYEVPQTANADGFRPRTSMR